MTSAVFVFLRTIVLNYEVGSNINGKLCLLSNSSKLGEKQKLQVYYIYFNTTVLYMLLSFVVATDFFFYLTENFCF